MATSKSRLGKWAGLALCAVVLMAAGWPVKLPFRVAELPARDSVFMNEVFLDMDEQGRYYYHTDMQTSVCSDSLCRLARLHLRWGLAGDYIGFDTVPGHPLTKNDHEAFTTQDYDKLHRALSDRYSILGDKSEKELFDPVKKRESLKIDGSTGATAKELKAVAVDGALYSTYTLWQMANGAINDVLVQQTKQLYNADFERQLLASEHAQGIILALQQWDDEMFSERFDEVLTILQKGIPLINFYLAKRVPPEVWQDRRHQKKLSKIWPTLDVNTRSGIPVKP